MRASRPRFPVDRERGLEIARAFFLASRGGDLGALRSLLAAAVTLHADGGKRSAAAAPIVGCEAVMALHAGLARRFAAKGSQLVRYGVINGLPGFVSIVVDGALQTTALAVEDGQVVAIYITRNPDKLRHLDDTRCTVRVYEKRCAREFARTPSSISRQGQSTGSLNQTSSAAPSSCPR